MLRDCPLIHDKGDSGAVLKISINDFNALGFEYGDSVDIKKADLSVYARDYMTGIGMDEQTVDNLRDILEN